MSFIDSVNQAQLLLRDLKIAQYAKLPPRAAFTAQIVGTLLGAVLNYGEKRHSYLGIELMPLVKS